MARLIDADRLAAFPHEPTSGTEDAITEWIEEVFSTEEIIDHKEALEKLCRKVINGFIGVIETEPTVDAVEVVHGYNTYGHDSMFECSVCGFVDLDTVLADGKYNYCPNCGAKMDGGNDEL